MKFSIPVILSGAGTSRSEVAAESKDAYSIQQPENVPTGRELQ
jgi:hypothetical protein